MNGPREASSARPGAAGIVVARVVAAVHGVVLLGLASTGAAAIGNVALDGLAVAAPRRALEPWPPSTPPKVDLPPEPPPPVSAPPPPPPPAATPPPPPPTVEQTGLSAPEPPAAESASAVVVFKPEPPPGRDAPYGSVGGQLFARTPRDELVLLPTARLQMDALDLVTAEANASGSTLTLGLARVDVAGWIYSKIYFDASADFASGPSLRHVDNYVAVAPWGNRAILQIGQFDAPFSLENRTSDRYLDFAERGAAVRAFAIPENKDQGIMFHSADPDGRFYCSLAVLNGEGPSVSGVDAHVDVMGRAFVAPFAFHDSDALREVTVGASLWTGDHANGPVFAPQATPGGYAFLDASLWWMSGATSPFELREHGRVNAVGLELDAPFAHRFGLRFEWFAKRQPLQALDVTDPAAPGSAGSLTLSGWSTYGEVWGWVLGDERMLGAPAAPGLELPPRLRDFSGSSIDDGRRVGTALAARVDYVDEPLSLGADAASAGWGVASVGTTKLTAVTVGASGWYTRRARLTLEYVYNRLDGSTPYLNGLDAKTEQELFLRTTLAL